MVDDDGDVILSRSEDGFVCIAGSSTEVKFTTTYDVDNCKDSVPPASTSNGDIVATATSNDGSLNVIRKIKCKK
jgi:hypothetical protein